MRVSPYRAAALLALSATALTSVTPAVALPVAATPVAAATANSVLSFEDSSTCAVSAGQLTWGVKESFRAYISGTIANGNWEVTNGATYTTPNFEFTNGTGSVDASNGVSVSFPGTVRFTGHEGVLDLQLSNPTVRILSADRGVLLLDMRSTDTSGAVKVDEQQVLTADINLTNALKVTSESVSIEAAPVELNQAGVDGFGGFYKAGEVLDPITFSASSEAACVAAALNMEVSEADPQTATETESTDAAVATEETAPAESGQRLPWIPIGFGVVAVFTIVISTATLLLGKKKSKA